MKKSGFFITFEGGEGVGKSTQVKLFTEYLIKNKIPFVFTREPGGLVECEEIRNLLLHSNFDLSIEAEALLFSASRAEHVKKIILPALKEGKVVVCDRFYDSFYAYQGYGRGLGITNAENLTKIACGNLEPNLTILLDMDVDKAFIRKGGVDKTDRIETESSEFHQKVNKGYKTLAKKFSKRIKIVNADDSIDNVQNNIIKLFEAAYNKK